MSEINLEQLIELQEAELEGNPLPEIGDLPTDESSSEEEQEEQEETVEEQELPTEEESLLTNL